MGIVPMLAGVLHLPSMSPDWLIVAGLSAGVAVFAATLLYVTRRPPETIQGRWERERGGVSR